MPAAPELIRSRSNRLVRRLRALKEQGAREGLALLEGPKLIEEATLSGIPIVEVAASPRLTRSTRGQRLARELEAHGTPIRWLTDEILDSLSEVEVSQGVLALARRPDFDEARLYVAVPLLLVAVAIQNPGNLGGLLRTAEAAGASGAYLTDGSADPFGWKALRGSMGSAFRLPHLAGLRADDALARLRARGVEAVAAVAGAPTRYDELDLRKPVAFVLGNEGAGLPDHLLHTIPLQVSIPMPGAVESLNVGVAAGVLMFEAARQRRPGRPA
jgi:TrmH family RNA methyltransferase